MTLLDILKENNNVRLNAKYIGEHNVLTESIICEYIISFQNLIIFYHNRYIKKNKLYELGEQYNYKKYKG